MTFALGTLASGASVSASVIAQAIEDGSTSDSVSLSSTTPDPNSANNSASATTSITEPAISVSGAITTRSSSLSNYQVATFTHASEVEPVSAFIATINWGDNTTSTGTITLSGTTYYVHGSHTYSSGGKHTIKTSVTEANNNGVTKADVNPGSLPPGERDVVRLSQVGGIGGPRPFSASPASTWLTDLIALEIQVADQLYNFGTADLKLYLLELEQAFFLDAASGDSAA